MELIKKEILNFLKKQKNPIGIKRIRKHLNLPRGEMSYLREVLKSLIREGVIVKTENNCYRLSNEYQNEAQKQTCHEFEKLYEGKIYAGRKGNLIFKVRGSKRVLRVIPPKNLSTILMDSDKVMLLKLKNRDAGIVATVTDRAFYRRLGRVENGRVKIRFKRIYVKGRVKSPIIEYITGKKAEVIKEFSDNVKGAYDLNIYLHSIKHFFPPEVMEESRHLTVEDSLFAKRLDLRNELVFTIDGEEAKDFDDAVSLKETKKGYVLGVHIADVSHFVEKGSCLDSEAMIRGVTTYMPGKVIPMLPERLSNDLCSLKPYEDRYTLSCIITLDRKGNVISYYLTKSVINSKARLTYEKLNEYFHGRSDFPYPDVKGLKETIDKMHLLSKKLRQKRLRKGALFLNVEKPYVKVSKKGELLDLKPQVQQDAEKLIEEFMLLANECVANFLIKRNLPGIFRIHPAPDDEKLADLFVLFESAGYKTYDKTLPELINSINDRNLHYITLRYLTRAEYSSRPGLHFGLNKLEYLHFTSPIRRYPDLVVHRIVKAAIEKTALPYKKSELEWIAKLCSTLERDAFFAELDTAEYFILKDIKEKGIRECEAIVSGFSEHTLFAELSGFYVDGMIPLSDLRGFYTLDPTGHFLADEKGKKITIGMKLKVKIAEIDPILRKLKLNVLKPVL